MIKCKICDSDLFPSENTIGKPLEYNICQCCWEEISNKQRQEYLKDGCIPITRFCLQPFWTKWCEKYGLKP